MIYTELQSTAIRLHIERDGRDVAHAYLFLITNDLHDAPYGLVEDIFVEEAYRGQGLGNELLRAMIEKARELGCYKLLATSRSGREDVHAWYERLGFTKYGAAFRMDF